MKVIIWGHKLFSHSHSFIHNGFYLAFKSLGYDVYWFDDTDAVDNFDFANSLFITEGQVDKKIPIRDDCKYVLHYCNLDRYNSKNSTVLERNVVSIINGLNLEKIEPFAYFQKGYQGRDVNAIYMLWATDLLPEQIENIDSYKRGDTVNWVGSIGQGLYGNVNELAPYALSAATHHKFFAQRTSYSIEQNIASIRDSYTAPVITGKWQLENGYIPCRLFKNISYGQIPCTNSKHVAAIFNGIKCNEDTYTLFQEAKEDTDCTPERLSLLRDLMNDVKENHTYINRAKLLLKCI